MSAGLLGRLPVKPVGERFEIQWASDYLVRGLPAPTYPVDVREGIGDTAWGMMGNDSYGNCGAVGEVHGEMVTAAAAQTTGPSSTSQLAVQRYVSFTGDPNPPGPGVNLADFLLWCYKNGYIKAFAPVDHTDNATCDAYMAAGFFLYCGYSLTDADMGVFNASEGQPFANRQPFTVANGEQPNPNNGHCMIECYSSGTADTDLHGLVTWAEFQPATVAWVNACREEAWLVVTTEEQMAAFTPQLLSDINALGGTGGSGQTPTPFPQPEPAPTPEPPGPAPAPVGPQPDLSDTLDRLDDSIVQLAEVSAELHAFLDA